MNETTMIRKKGDITVRPYETCHDGEGILDFTEVLNCENSPQRRLNFIHDDVLKPGVSVGSHRHERDEEYYYFLSGKGIMILDGERHAVEEGDLTAVFPGGSHGLMNTSGEDMRIIVISVRCNCDGP